MNWRLPYMGFIIYPFCANYDGVTAEVGCVIDLKNVDENGEHLGCPFRERFFDPGACYMHVIRERDLDGEIQDATMHTNHFIEVPALTSKQALQVAHRLRRILNAIPKIELDEPNFDIHKLLIEQLALPDIAERKKR